MPTEPRPKFSPEIAKIAAAEIVSDLTKAGHLRGYDFDQCVRDLAKYGRQYSDGYEIATSLDDSAGWSCNFAMTEILDGFGSAVDDALSQAEKEWVKRCGIQPPLAVGARVSVPHGETGEITEIYKHGAAKYLVKIDDDAKANPPTNSRRIVNFEDATPEATEAA